MNSYNGFSPTQRYKALAYHKKQIANGAKEARPHKCDGCGTRFGFLAWHSEDYSEPFGPHIGEYGLCYRCHMQIHCRFRNPIAFQNYADMIEAGKRFESYNSSSWERFKQENLGPLLIGHIEKIDNFETEKSLIIKLAR